MTPDTGSLDDQEQQEARLRPDRLDRALVDRGLVASRSRARDLVRRRMVMVQGAVATRPAMPVGPDMQLALLGGGADRVSRAAEKLSAALDRLGLDPAGRIALDVGASTGGFTEVLLERGAAKVYAVDVGRGQLHERLARDSRVVSLEGTDARRLTRAQVPEAIMALVADVSFISLAKALPAALALTGPGAWLVALVKPQFEAGPEHVGAGGIVRDETIRARVLEEVVGWLGSQPGWRVLGTLPSPIPGGSGNVEMLVGARRDA